VTLSTFPLSLSLSLSPRLVITPLTDRCWLTLTGSYGLKLGAAPAGPAGTGKTETSKDLAKAIGIFCIVFNCSDQIDYRMMAKLFRGLAQSGCWTCLDEFNRIDIEVLSVIAQQLLELREGRLLGKPDINFMGVQIGLKDHHVIITMNPGYAGRTELPDNLQVCFRPVAMMVPNYALIAEIMLFAEGFSEAKTLSRKMCKLYILCSEQLSQQPHYDYGLRAVKSVLVMAGALKRAMPEGSSEDVTLIRALVDSNVPKFLSDDLPLFAAIVKDLFPGVAIEAAAAGELNVALDAEIQEQGLQRVPRFVEKVIQFFDVLNIRFGATLVGPTGSGKTTCYRLLAAVNDRLREANAADERFQRVHIDVLNPKCITMGELYGEFHPLTLEWHDGLASTIMRRAAGEEGEDRSWVIFDGPIDALWIENMNTVLDDNMTLCLASGERIKLRSQMRMIFEVADLAVASPATVSRIGVVYMTSSDLGWRPFVRSWVPRLDKDTFVCPPMIQERLLQLFEAVTPKMLAFQRKNCEEPVECCDIQLVTSLCTLLQSLIWDGCEVLLDDTTPMPERLSLVDKMFAFSLAWSIGGSTDDRGWDRMDEQAQVACLDAGMQLALPSGKCLFEVYLDVKTNQFLPWTDIISPFDYSASVGDGKGADFFSLVVETEDTTRFRSLLTRLIGQDRPAFVTGATGTGKTAVLNSLLGSLQAPAEEGGMDMLAAPINFSAQTSSRVTQSTLTSKLEKKRRGILGPPGGKKRVGVFVDDVNMPIVEEYGAQPPVELLRQLLDFGGMYDRDKLFWTELEGVLLLTAAAPPGGGRSKVTPRFVRHFNVLCMPRAGEAAMSLIFGSMLKGYWSMGPGFDADVIKRVDSVVAATIEVYTRITAELRPTPSRFHYAFNLRDVSKVFQGMLMVVRAKCRSVRDAVRLWGHEVHRVFRDRLISAGDQSWFDGLMGELLSRHLRVGEDVMLGTDAPVWCDFLKGMGEGAPRLYEESGDTVKLKTILEAALDDYNASHIAQMRLVMFSDAISHVCRAARILRQPRGSAMLVGVGGSGRQSLARLAAFTCGMECMQVEITRGYGIQEFREDLKSAMVKTGVEGKGVAFLMTDTQIVVEAMLEDINNLLNSGEVPDLWNQEELDKVAGDMVPVLRDNDLPGFETRMGCLAAFVKRIRANLHMLLCMSPVGDSLRIRCRNFPALINCTTIDWFFPWPESALVSVAEFLLEGLSLPSDDVRGGIVSMCGAVHTSIADAAIRFHSELRRNVYITPKSYLDLIDSYKRELHNLRGGIDTRLSQMTAGVTKLNETNEMVASLKEELKALEPVLEEKSAAADKLLAQVEIDKAESALVQDRVSKEEQDVGAQAAEVAAVQAEAQAELDVALPALEKALKALDSLTKGDITEVKSFAKPPEAVQIVMEAVCLLFDMKTDWDSAKKLLTDSTFLDKLKSYDKDNIKESTLKKLRVYITNPIMQIDVVSKVSKAATGLCMFVHAMDVYAKVAKVVAPKQARVDELNAVLDSANATLAGKQAELRAVIERVAALQQQCDETVAERTRLAAEADATAKRLIRAEKLTSGLSNEGVRWTAACEVLSANKISIVGDAFIACASLSYLGPFTGSYRAELVSHWIEIGKDAGLPLTDGCGIGSTLGDPVEIREWQNNGLPTDTVSAESAIMVLKGSRWPLVIDPQGQANRWIKNTYSDRMQVTVMSDPNLLRALENCVRNGKVLLLEDVTEHVEPSLEPILQKAVFKQGARTLLRVGDSDVDYDAAFRLFMTSKMPNPHYMPEVCIKVNLTNFTVTMEGLEDQLLGQVSEKPTFLCKQLQLIHALVILPLSRLWRKKDPMSSEGRCSSSCEWRRIGSNSLIWKRGYCSYFQHQVGIFSMTRC
jgi:dynein heavy chain